MAGNTTGSVFRVTTFGESHGQALGCIIDGCPAGIPVSIDRIQQALDRRRPGASFDGKHNNVTTSRNEADRAEILSGVFEGKSEGTPIAIIIRNTAHHSSDYENLKTTFRPGHADFSYFKKYGMRDYRGGGRSSGRETAARVAAGAVALMILETQHICVTAYTERAAGISIKKMNYSEIEQNALRAPDCAAAEKMMNQIEILREKGDSAGGIVACTVTGIPAGLGEPVFDKLDAELAHAMLSIGAVKGIEFGSGFAAADSTGSINNDPIRLDPNTGLPLFTSNNAGGILGGISTGADLFFRIAIKPVPSIFQSQQTIQHKVTNHDSSEYAESELVIEGRHDVCLCPRIVPVVEAMAALVITDLLLRNECSRHF
jgi:chorismate synthase